MFKNNNTINSLELASISKKVFMLFIKDLINLTSSKKGLSIKKALIQLQKGAPAIAAKPSASSLKGSGVGRFINSGRTSTSGIIGNGLIGLKKNNQLLIKLISFINSESLTRKRTRLSKIFGNKTLWAKLQNKINKHNNSLSLFRSCRFPPRSPCRSLSPVRTHFFLRTYVRSDPCCTVG